MPAVVVLVDCMECGPMKARNFLHFLQTPDEFYLDLQSLDKQLSTATPMNLRLNPAAGGRNRRFEYPW